jgi:sulfate adenylate transferase, subunit 1
MRAALNWQSPLVIGFSLENVDENEIHQAENLLLRSSRHTYTYRPEGNEDYVKVVEHLVDAGLVVLLVLDSYREEAKELEVNENYKRWSEVRKDSDSADAIFARVQSLTMLNNIMGPDNWII